MTYLLDVSSLLALLWENHVSHARVQAWAGGEQLAVCPITELGFLRISTQSFGANMDDARQSLSAWLHKCSPNFIACNERWPVIQATTAHTLSLRRISISAPLEPLLRPLSPRIRTTRLMISRALPLQAISTAQVI